MMEESPPPPSPPPPPPPPPSSAETMTTVSPGHYFRNTVSLSPPKDDKHHHHNHQNQHQHHHHHHQQHQRQQHQQHHHHHHHHLYLPSSSPISSSVGQSPSTITTISSSIAGVSSHPNQPPHTVVPPPTLLTQTTVSTSSAATEIRRNINSDRKARSRSPTRNNNNNNNNNAPTTATTPERVFRSRYNHHKISSKSNNHRKNHRKRTRSSSSTTPNTANKSQSIFQKYCYNHTIVRSTLSCMNLIGKLLVWFATIASVSGVVWYSYELKNNGTDPHLIAWFSAGAFVLLGFPISIYGIVMHLLNYNQPHVQCYVVRILWMVPIYSIGSWISLRYKNYAIYIETLRDCYESFVLYSFLQFLIEVLGGEDALILMLKDKSPTRGVHMWGLQYCGLKPWLMGQPVRRTYDHIPEGDGGNNNNLQPIASPTVATIHPVGAADNNINHFDNNNTTNTENNATGNGFMTNSKRYKRVHWTSPFFIYCKFGVLQYVLLKLICTFLVLILEKNHIYKEGDFTYKGGYLYICTITNLSQCWALYCLIFFYYATKNELGPINPVGKFLAVKALVFFTWWQSLGIAILYQYNLIPYYNSGSSKFFGFGTIVDDDYTSSSSTASSSSLPLPLSEDAALALDELGGSSLGDLVAASTTATTASSSLSSSNTEWTSEDVAKGLQDYLICIEMFVAALVHVFVFSHTEFDSQAVEARESALHQQPHLGGHYNKRLGRKWKDWDNKSAYSGTTLSTGNNYNGSNHTPSGRGGGAMGSSSMEMVPLPPLTAESSNDESCGVSIHEDDDDDDLIHPLDRMEQQKKNQNNNGDDDVERLSTVKDGEDGDNDGSFYSMSSSELNDDDLEDDGDDDDEFDEDDEYNNERRGLLSSSSISRKNKRGTSSSKKTGGSNNNNKTTTTTTTTKRPGFVKALLDSAIPQDLRDNTVGIIKGEYVVERKTLLHHAATSDSYDLFSRVSRPNIIRKKNNVTTASDAANSNANAAVAATTTTTAPGFASITSASLGGQSNEKQRHEPASNPRPPI